MTARATEITDARARVEVRTAVEDADPCQTPASVQTVIRDREGRQVARAEGPSTTLGTGRDRGAHPRRSRSRIAGPSRIRISTRVESTLDERRCRYASRLGLRTIEFTTDGKFLLNGRHVPLQGVCLHHDLGPLGAAAFDRGIRAPAPDHEGDGRERDPHEPQPARARVPRPHRSHGLRGDGRGVRRVEAEQDALRLRPVLRRVERARHPRHGPPRPQPPVGRHVEHRQRDPRAAQRAGRRGHGGAPRGVRTRRRSDAAGHRRDEQPDAGARDRLRQAARSLRRELQPRRLRARERQPVATRPKRPRTTARAIATTW